MTRPPHTRRLHYAWIILGAGFFVLFACLGLARFSFGMLLPPMAEALGLSYAQRGYLGTGYFVGYLAMVGASPWLGRRLGCRGGIALGLGVVAASMGALALAGSYGAALVCYSLTGVGSGAANILMMALTARWFGPLLRGTATGAVIAGNGFGIIVSGFLIPAVTQSLGAGDGWRAGWGVLAGICAAVCAVAWAALRDDPAAMGLSMLGETPPPVKERARAVAAHHAPPADPAARRRERATLLHLGALYFLFGCTYIVYATFIVTTLVDEHGMSGNVAGRFWAWVGLFSLFSGPLFGRISDRMTRRAGFMAVFGTQTAAYLLAGLGGGTAALYASIFLYGIAVWAIPTIMSATVADRLGPVRAAGGFAFVTFFFAVGQVIGPTGAGWLADLTGGFTLSYALSAGLTLLGGVLALFLRPGRSGRAGRGAG